MLHEVGGAIVIREPSLRLFEAWNVAKTFDAEAVRVDVIEMHDPQGAKKNTIPADLANDGVAYSIHRADVHKMLVDGVAPGNIHLGKECTGVRDGADRAVVTFADGSEVRAKVVVGADGIKSIVRRLVSQDEPVCPRRVGVGRTASRVRAL